MPDPTRDNPTADTAATETETVHHVPPRRKRARKHAISQLNLTSMIDVIFLLLIYFVITANFTVDEGVLTAKLPQGAGAPTSSDLELPKQPLNIVLRSVDASGVNVTINGVERVGSFTELYQRMMGLQGGTYPADNPVVIQPDDRVRWQHVVNAFNAAVRAKYTNVSFSTGE